MAEYVRRRRPPANHPYWAHLHDRAHPPWVLPLIAVPASVGLGIGLCAGVRPPFTMSEAVKSVVVAATGVAAASALLTIVSRSYDAVRQPSRREQWTGAALAGTWGLFVGVALFAVSFAAMFPMVAWYAACSGEGPWLGMLYGAIIGGTPFTAIAYFNYQRWWARQKQWPRWDRMRTPRPRTSLNLTQLSPPPANLASGDAPRVAGPDHMSRRPGSDFNPSPPIGESGEET
jgi:hypothetical protein